jgi:hypothetical protein
MIALTHMDYCLRSGDRPWAPTGLFVWRGKGQPEADRVEKALDAEVADLAGEWPPLRAGLFGGDLERFRHAREELTALIQEARRNLF